MLSISVFVALIAKHRNPNNIKIKIVTDNLKLVNRSNAHLEYKHLYPNNTLKSEYNVTEQIFLINSAYKIVAMFHHVYCHQNSKSNRELTIKEKFNMKVDTLAS